MIYVWLVRLNKGNIILSYLVSIMNFYSHIKKAKRPSFLTKGVSLIKEKIP
ncbi:hypothetical protein SOVF_193470 [Spinacia oleracea]|nr:hypothetical protein SOVF_193470 [Spinacia oleracea]